GNRPETVTVQLLADGEPEGEPVILTSAENWTDTWEGLDLNASGTAIDYSVEEIEAPEGYEVSTDNENHGNMMITNDYEPEAIDIPVTIVWYDADNQDGVRPDNVRVNLPPDQDIERQAAIEDVEDGVWSQTHTNLPANGN